MPPEADPLSGEPDAHGMPGIVDAVSADPDGLPGGDNGMRTADCGNDLSAWNFGAGWPGIANRRGDMPGDRCAVPAACGGSEISWQPVLTGM